MRFWFAWLVFFLRGSTNVPGRPRDTKMVVDRSGCRSSVDRRRRRLSLLLAGSTQDLQARFHSDVELADLQIKLVPQLNVTGRNLTLRYHGRTDIPPLIQIASFSLSSGYLGLLRPVKHIPLLQLENLQITIPPRDPTHVEPPHKNSPLLSRLSNAVIDRVVCEQTVIRILPKQAGKIPLDWDIHNLTGGTPITGEYKFTNANLTPLPGIGGTLSSIGKYAGVLAELEVDGETDTPNFSLDAIGTPMPLHTDFEATVNGTNGDTLLHPVTAVLGKSVIIAEGKVVLIRGAGHLITIEANVPNGRIQDFLKLATRAEKPIFSGPVTSDAVSIMRSIASTRSST